jgi:hypothetical protein
MRSPSREYAPANRDMKRSYLGAKLSQKRFSSLGLSFMTIVELHHAMQRALATRGPVRHTSERHAMAPSTAAQNQSGPSSGVVSR